MKQYHLNSIQFQIPNWEIQKAWLTVGQAHTGASIGIWKKNPKKPEFIISYIILVPKEQYGVTGKYSKSGQIAVHFVFLAVIETCYEPSITVPIGPGLLRYYLALVSLFFFLVISAAGLRALIECTCC